MHLTQAQRVLLLNIARDGLLEQLTGRLVSVHAAGAGTGTGTGTGAGAAAGDSATPCDSNPNANANANPNANPNANADHLAPADPALTTPAGCFVSLHERITHRLRGCVGRLDPEMPLWRVVRETAADVLRDPRFIETPVTPHDVPLLQIEISVLSPPRQASDPLDFDLLTDGIYLIHGGRSGFFLPQVARETKWSKQQLLGRLCEEKLALPADVWQRPDARLFTFKVDVIGPAALRDADM